MKTAKQNLIEKTVRVNAAVASATPALTPEQAAVMARLLDGRTNPFRKGSDRFKIWELTHQATGLSDYQARELTKLEAKLAKRVAAKK